jgi:hypothetical protein
VHTSGTGSPRRKAATYIDNKNTEKMQTSMPRVVLETTTLLFKLAKMGYTLDQAANMTGIVFILAEKLSDIRTSGVCIRQTHNFPTSWN